jgi:hypothetical protein
MCTMSVMALHSTGRVPLRRFCCRYLQWVGIQLNC